MMTKTKKFTLVLTTFVYVGLLLLVILRAASQNIAIEVEQVGLKNIRIITDTSSSTGEYVEFSSNDMIEGNVLWQSNATLSIHHEWSAWSDDNVGADAPTEGHGSLYEGWMHPDIQITPDIGSVLPGQKAYRVYVPVGENRHELKQAHPVREGFENRVFSEGDDVWVSWATKITQLDRTEDDWQLFNQIRHINEAGLPITGSPHGLSTSPVSANYQWSSDPRIYAGAEWRHDTNIPVELNKTIQWSLHSVWSSDPEKGSFELFANDGSGWKAVVPRHMQATLLHNDHSNTPGRAAFRFGVYRGPKLAASSSAEVYMAGLTVATSREKAEFEAFGGLQ